MKRKFGGKGTDKVSKRNTKMVFRLLDILPEHLQYALHFLSEGDLRHLAMTCHSMTSAIQEHAIEVSRTTGAHYIQSRRRYIAAMGDDGHMRSMQCSLFHSGGISRQAVSLKDNIRELGKVVSLEDNIRELGKRDTFNMVTRCARLLLAAVADDFAGCSRGVMRLLPVHGGAAIHLAFSHVNEHKRVMHRTEQRVIVSIRSDPLQLEVDERIIIQSLPIYDGKYPISAAVSAFATVCSSRSMTGGVLVVVDSRDWTEDTVHSLCHGRGGGGHDDRVELMEAFISRMGGIMGHLSLNAIEYAGNATKGTYSQRWASQIPGVYDLSALVEAANGESYVVADNVYTRYVRAEGGGLRSWGGVSGEEQWDQNIPAAELLEPGTP